MSPQPHRPSAFNTVPRDDYSPYLLFILGEEGGRVLGAPFVYRIFSVAAAVPFYYVLPYFEFSQLEEVNVTYMRAVEALAMASYVAMLISCIVIYQITCKRFGGSGPAGVIASLGALLLFQFSGYMGVDPVGIMVVCLLVYFSQSYVLFGILIILSAGFNEKISLIFSILMISRVLVAKEKQFIPCAILSVLAFAIYLSVRTILDVPGSEDQMEVTNFVSAALATIAELTSLKRFVLSVVPFITLVIIYVMAAREWKLNPNQYSKYFSIVDISALLGLFAISMGVSIQVFGRMAMFCFPLYLPLAAIYIERLTANLSGDSSLSR